MTRHWASAALLPALLFLTSASPAGARTWYVKPDSTGDVPTISVAVDSAAAQGDTVLLADGTFEGAGNMEIDCLDKAVTIVSESRNPEACIIDGGEGAFEPMRAFRFRESSCGSPRLEGVTITGFCQGVLCDTASCPEITNCIFRDNVCRAAEIGPGGAAIYCLPDSRPTITDCLFQDNGATGGGAIWCYEAQITVTSTTFAENGADHGGGMGMIGGAAVLTDCLFENNIACSAVGMRAGAGLLCSGNTELLNCVFRDNIALDGYGGGICVFPYLAEAQVMMTGCLITGNISCEGPGLDVLDGLEYDAELTISGCTFSGNRAGSDWCVSGALGLIGNISASMENTIIAYTDGCEAIAWYGLTLELSCCNLFGNSGGDWTGSIADHLGTNGNISADPLFCDTLSGDFRLETCSPCLPGNHPDGFDCGVPMGAFCSGCPCGGATEPATWGAIKAMYR